MTTNDQINSYKLIIVIKKKKNMKSLVPKRYKSVLINLSKNVFSLPRKWQDENLNFLFKTIT